MSVRYYAESMNGNESWQVVCEDLETKQCSIIGNNLSPADAQRIADDLQAANLECTKNSLINDSF